MDFAELLLRPTSCGSTNHILQHYVNASPTFWWTNSGYHNIQYAWIRLLAGDTGKVMIVGDDDQSIYGWRGAQVGIQRFLNDFPARKPSVWSRTTVLPATY
ncbi:MAG: UvrD-helicase domain-containing protein [Enterobacter hormaechei]